jgi:hypothetical protein
MPYCHHTHSIDRWDDATGSNLYEHLAGVNDLLLARGTFAAAVKRRPGAKITLRNAPASSKRRGRRTTEPPARAIVSLAAQDSPAGYILALESPVHSPQERPGALPATSGVEWNWFSAAARGSSRPATKPSLNPTRRLHALTAR